MKLIKNKDWKVAPKIIFASKKYPFENKTLNIKEYWDDAVKYYKDYEEFKKAELECLYDPTEENYNNAKEMLEICKSRNIDITTYEI